MLFELLDTAMHNTQCSYILYACRHFVCSVFQSLHVIKKCVSRLLDVFTINHLPDNIFGLVMDVCL